jgi:RNA polymerase sigma-B factor
MDRVSRYSSSQQRLTKEEVAKLFSQFKASGDLEIRNKLVTNFMYLAEIIAKKFANRGVDYEDLLQVGFYALIKAVERFDDSYNNEFASFAIPTIVGEIKRYFRDKNWAVRVPRRIQEAMQKINGAKRELSQKLQRTPTVEDLANYTGLGEETILEAIEVGQGYTAYSLEQAIGQATEEKTMTLMDVLGAEDKSLGSIENLSALRFALEKLDQRKQKIIYYRYFKNYTQARIARILDISQVHVSRLEKEAIKELYEHVI